MGTPAKSAFGNKESTQAVIPKLTLMYNLLTNLYHAVLQIRLRWFTMENICLNSTDESGEREGPSEALGRFLWTKAGSSPGLLFVS